MIENGCLISVIIPVYNVKPYLAEALKSVLQQSYQNLEIIIIDDGSTDGSGEICDEYAKKDERVIVVHQDNKGLSGARNTGLEMIHGDAVSFIDPDDAVHPDFIMTLLSDMIRENTDVAICGFSNHKTTEQLAQTNGEKARANSRKGRYDRRTILRYRADDIICPGVCMNLFRKELWKTIRFPEGHVYEDMDTSFRIYNLCTSVYVNDQALYYRRIRNGSITGTDSLENRRDRIRAYSHFESFIRANIPEIYTVDHLKRIGSIRLQMMIRLYYLTSGKKISGNKVNIDKTTCQQVRQEIIEAGETFDIKMFKPSTRIAYRLIKNHPFLFKLVYPAYISLRSVLISLRKHIARSRI